MGNRLRIVALVGVLVLAGAAALFLSTIKPVHPKRYPEERVTAEIYYPPAPPPANAAK